MAQAFIYGNVGSAGIRTKSITSERYEQLPDEEKYNPKVVWIIEDDDATDFQDVSGVKATTKLIMWETYCKLSLSDQMDKDTIWVIQDKTPEELNLLQTKTNTGSKLYNVAGVPVTNLLEVPGVDGALDANSPNPIANLAVTRELQDIKQALGGCKFSITETGGLRITYETPDEE